MVMKIKLKKENLTKIIDQSWLDDSIKVWRIFLMDSAFRIGFLKTFMSETTIIWILIIKGIMILLVACSDVAIKRHKNGCNSWTRPQNKAIEYICKFYC